MDSATLIREAVAGHPVLADLEAELQEEVVRQAQVLYPERGETLFRADDPARQFFYCRDGQLKLYRLAPDGNEKIIALIHPGSSFAEAAVFMEPRSYPVHCTTLQSATVVAFDAGHFRELIRRNPETALGLIAKLSKRLRNRVADIESLSLQNSRLRVVNHLLREAAQSPEGDRLELAASKKDIAGLLALQPETLSRVFAQLQEEGLIEVDRRQIILRQPERLVAVAEGRD